MEYKQLDSDTQSIIEGMCLKTGWSKEKSILALVEFGMVSMIASISENPSKKMQSVYDAINSDKNLKETAQIYQSVWCL